MANQSLVKTQGGQERTIGQYLNSEKVSGMLVSSLGSEKSKQRFVAGILAASAANPALKECDYATVVSAGLLANALDLSLSPSLGLAYVVPFKDTKNDRTVATFIIGYRGYIQLAIRSGYYADIDVTDVRAGEYCGRNSETRKPVFNFVEDDEEREKLPVVGYKASFEYLNGFKKTIYWSKEKMLKHADTYSKAFSLNGVKSPYPNKCRVSFAEYEAGKVPENELWKYSSFWYKNFDEMAMKTLIRQLISKWGIMSIEMQTAFETDTQSMRESEEANAFSSEDSFFNNSDGTTSSLNEDENNGEEMANKTENAEQKKTRKKKAEEKAVDDSFF